MIASSHPAEIRCGIGGWVFPAWRGGVFYPAGLPQREELAHASRALRCIEINGTFYRTPTPGQCAQWAAQTPQGFRFSMKAPRYLVQRRDLSSTVDAAAPFLEAALALGDRLGPLLWQFDPRHPADAEALDRLMAELPKQLQGVPLQHALEVRNAAAHGPALVAAARRHGVALVIEDSDEAPLHGDVSAGFVYARIKRSQARLKEGLPAPVQRRWAERALRWSRGEPVDDLPCLAKPAALAPREVYLLCIGAGKARNPAAAMALQRLIDDASDPAPTAASTPSRTRPPRAAR
ncbi:DUF72 domain-containing protein [Stenotrophomonas pavanii]|uniref:DUF72 domain-containing protein n=2 Tax=Gammaproteobacteria TaxID=1236 RepID=A0A246L3J5_9GAMM|nr:MULTISPECIES: DUF72 domain-containing protein [Stenotrophomonas]MBC9079240.1 DUF72 domain-containing protein [Stenotrophomonas maltophilia]TGR52063.1 DUF72 domain-containing protein [bacterium M00.F.Ca.ET.199.01.1.1]TGT05663.1 DUF72 domain-containing protein [bacterium M00.F.Ca.ET.177.01.1.1]TGT62739.1 DUF72 domain-containing protein [Mesorhizobium sp. M00.F.Ca.ET.170.01.1.1]TGU14157.1 DUF72 domain-containing protein [bacterium M00.F.Ca.ET.163.01.1.1]TGU96060.1 DUF72 domain-containing prot